MRKSHPSGGHCGGDRVLGLAARGGPGRNHRHSHRLNPRERDHRRIGQRLDGGGFRRDPSVRLLHAAAWPRGLQEDQILRSGPWPSEQCE